MPFANSRSRGLILVTEKLDRDSELRKQLAARLETPR